MGKFADKRLLVPVEEVIASSGTEIFPDWFYATPAYQRQVQVNEFGSALLHHFGVDLGPRVG